MAVLVQSGQETSLVSGIVARARARQKARDEAFDSSFGATKEESLQVKERCRERLEDYAQYVYGYEPQRLHRYWCEIMRKVINREIHQTKVLFLAPPNTAKSTYISQIGVTHYLGNHPDHYALFLTSSDPNAKAFNTSIQSVLDENPAHAAIFESSFCRPDKKRGWSGDGLFLQGTPRNNKDAAYRAAGWGTRIQGRRADLLIVDDPLDQEDAESESVCETARRYYDMTVEPRLNPEGFVFAVMTRWNDHDMASHMISRVREDGDWLIISTPMEAEDERSEFYPDVLGREPGELLWPERFNQEFVDDKKANMRISEYAAVYQCSSYIQGGDVFEDEAWFQELPTDFYEQREDGLSMRDRLKIIDAWDLAFSENERSCFTSKITMGLDSQMNIYVLDVINERLSTLEVENAMVLSIQSNHPIVVGVEETAFRKKITVALCRRVLQRALANIQVVPPDKDKVSRARLPAFRGQLGKLYVAKGPWRRPFIRQCLMFPDGKFNDMVDALSLGALIATMIDNLKKLTKSKRLTFSYGDDT